MCVSNRQGLGSGGYVSTGDQLQESVYSKRGQYEDPPSSSRPRPVGGSTGTAAVSGCVLHTIPPSLQSSLLELQCINPLTHILSFSVVSTSRCPASPPDTGGSVQSDRSIPWSGSQHVWAHWLQLAPAALRPGPIQTRSQQRECES